MARKIRSRINSSKNSVTQTDKIRGHRAVHGKLRAIMVGDGAPSIPEMQAELQDYTDVLLGRVEPPVNYGILTLMETADVYYARAMELTMLLQQAEREGIVTRGSSHYKFRTGELRSFSELAKRAADLGSRRLTQEQMRFEASKLGRDSKFSPDEYE